MWMDMENSRKKIHGIRVVLGASELATLNAIRLSTENERKINGKRAFLNRKLFRR